MVSCQLDDRPKMVGFAGVEPASPPRSESRARTCDILGNSQALFQLSYLGMVLLPTCQLHERRCSLVPRTGFEPVFSWVKARRP